MNHLDKICYCKEMGYCGIFLNWDKHINEFKLYWTISQYTLFYKKAIYKKVVFGRIFRNLLVLAQNDF